MNSMTNKTIKCSFIVCMLATLLIGCNKFVYDDMADCSRGVYLKIYSQTECEDQPVYKNLDNVDLFVFDEQGILASMKHIDKYNADAKDEVFVPVKKEGRYDIVAWTGIDDKFTKSNLKIGETSKEDLFITLKSTNKKAVELTDNQVFATRKLRRVIVGDEENMIVHDSVNILEMTNRVSVRVVGFDHPRRL